MPEPERRRSPRGRVAAPGGVRQDADAVICERCGAEMFRMHAVWRCPVCRYKTDCCGW